MNNKQKLLLGAAAAAGAFVVAYATNLFNTRRTIQRSYHVYKYKIKDIIEDECEVLFIGDSITWLYKLDKHFPERDYINRGISGDRTFEILSRCETTFSSIRAKKIVLLAGINDLGGGKSSYEVLVNLFKIVESAKKYNPTAEIFVESVYPVNNNGSNKRHDTCTQKIFEVNRSLENNAEKFGYTYIDMFSVLKTENDGFIDKYTYDGLHPTEEGYMAITQELNKYI